MKYVTYINDKKFEIEIQKDGTLLVNGEVRNVDFLTLDESLFSVLMDNKSYEVVIDETDGQYEVLIQGRLYTGQVLDERAQLLASRSGGVGVDSGEISIKSALMVALRLEVFHAMIERLSALRRRRLIPIRAGRKDPTDLGFVVPVRAHFSGRPPPRSGSS